MPRLGAESLGLEVDEQQPGGSAERYAYELRPSAWLRPSARFDQQGHVPVSQLPWLLVRYPAVGKRSQAPTRVKERGNANVFICPVASYDLCQTAFLLVQARDRAKASVLFDHPLNPPDILHSSSSLPCQPMWKPM